MHIIVGLGNPGEEYERTRHNTGREMVMAFHEAGGFDGWREEAKIKRLEASGKIGKEKVTLVLPNTFMNNSGKAVSQIKDLRFKVKGKGKEKRTEVENLIVIHDELDIPLGRFKISFNKSSGGHRGVESIIRALGTEGFVRVRVGISKDAGKGKVKKPVGEKAVGDFILGKFKPAETDIFKKESKKVAEALKVIIEEGREKAMAVSNQKT